MFVVPQLQHRRRQLRLRVASPWTMPSQKCTSEPATIDGSQLFRPHHTISERVIAKSILSTMQNNMVEYAFSKSSHPYAHILAVLFPVSCCCSTSWHTWSPKGLRHASIVSVCYHRFDPVITKSIMTNPSLFCTMRLTGACMFMH